MIADAIFRNGMFILPYSGLRVLEVRFFDGRKYGSARRERLNIDKSLFSS